MPFVCYILASGGKKWWNLDDEYIIISRHHRVNRMPGSFVSSDWIFHLFKSQNWEKIVEGFGRETCLHPAPRFPAPPPAGRAKNSRAFKRSTPLPRRACNLLEYPINTRAGVKIHRQELFSKIRVGLSFWSTSDKQATFCVNVNNGFAPRLKTQL